MGLQPGSRIGARLREARENKGMTQKEVGHLLNVTRSVISRYESGTNDPSTENVRIMAEAYGVSPNFIYGQGESASKLPYDFKEILQEPDAGRAFIKWHGWRWKFKIPDAEYIKGEEGIVQHYGPLPMPASEKDEIAHYPDIPGTGIFSDDESNE